MNPLSVSAVRMKIHERFETSALRENGFSDDDEFAAYYTAKFLIDDAQCALDAHRKRGFSSDFGLAYAELWGVLQSVVIQQDSILEIYKSFFGKCPSKMTLGSAWYEIRNLRNEIGGHPIASGNGKYRSFLGRNFGDYTVLQYEKYEISTRDSSYPEIALGHMIDSYQRRAAIILYLAYRKMRTKWIPQ